jgi:hypothetical protein
MATETASEPKESLLRCDTCGKLTTRVSRVVVDAGYNRANARAIYNCPECYEKKLHDRDPAASPSGGGNSE